MTFVSTNDIIADYIHCVATGDAGYSFLKVLRSQEALLFLEMLSDEQRLACFKKRSIKTVEYCSILEKLPLECKYKIYRYRDRGMLGFLCAGSSKIVICTIYGTNCMSAKASEVRLLLHNNIVVKMSKELQFSYQKKGIRPVSLTESEIQ